MSNDTATPQIDLGKHAGMAAYEHADVFFWLWWFGRQDELFEEGREHPDGGGIKFGRGGVRRVVRRMAVPKCWMKIGTFSSLCLDPV